MTVLLVVGGSIVGSYGDSVVIVEEDDIGTTTALLFEPGGDIQEYLSDIFYEQPELTAEVSRLTNVQPIS